jgi:hypothetical protein
MTIVTDNNGKLLNKNQILDYWYRADSLSDMTFYEFSKYVTLKSNTAFDTTRHSLHIEHPLAHTHHLLEHANKDLNECYSKLVPRVVGCSIPQEKTGQLWKFFVLVHFMPFGVHCPLLTNGHSIEDTFNNFTPSTASHIVMKNWEDIHECEDEHDGERLRKRATLTAESLAVTHAVSNSVIGLHADEIDVASSSTINSQTTFAVLQAVCSLKCSRWLMSINLSSPTLKQVSSIPSQLNIPEPTTSQIKSWLQNVKIQEKNIAQSRQISQDSMQIEHSNSISNTEHVPQLISR